MTEVQLIKDRTRGTRAKAILEDDLFKEAIQATEKALIEFWLSTPAKDTDARERIWQAVQTNRKYPNFLLSVMNNGKVAEAELKQLTQEAERKKRFGII